MHKISGNMRNAFIRISSKNVISKDNEVLGKKAGEEIIYTKDDIIYMLEDWVMTKKFKYYLIEHNQDTENVHFHIVLVFDNKSQCKWSTIKRKFPYGKVDRCIKGVRLCVQYLVHMNNPEKYQYSWEEVLTSAPEKLEEYKLPGNIHISVKLKNITDKIIKGELKEYQINEIEPEIYIKFMPKIKAAFEYRQRLIMKNPNRNVTIICSQGVSRAGKSLMAKAYAQKMEKSIYFTSSSNDPLQDYQGQTILCIDDFDYTYFCISDFLKALDPYNTSSIKSRYKNKVFTGDTIIINTNIPIIKWYSGEKEELREALFKRISCVIDFNGYKYEDMIDYNTKNNIAKYTMNKIVHISEMKEETLDHLMIFGDWTLKSLDGIIYEFDLSKYFNLGYEKNTCEDVMKTITSL